MILTILECKRINLFNKYYNRNILENKLTNSRQYYL